MEITNCTDRGSIVKISGVATPAALSQIVQFARDNEGRFDRSTVINVDKKALVVDQHRTSANLTVDKNADPVVDMMLFDIFDRAVRVFIDKTKHEFVPASEDEGFTILRYVEGSEYKLHVDDNPAVRRHLSAILYLNDDYEGGELHFPRHDLKIKPKAGDVILFPSNFEYPHASLIITKGTKLAVTTWFK